MGRRGTRRGAKGAQSGGWKRHLKVERRVCVGSVGLVTFNFNAVVEWESRSYEMKNGMLHDIDWVEGYS